MQNLSLICDVEKLHIVIVVIDDLDYTKQVSKGLKLLFA
jgi:hypothetical protein